MLFVTFVSSSQLSCSPTGGALIKVGGRPVITVGRRLLQGNQRPEMAGNADKVGAKWQRLEPPYLTPAGWIKGHHPSRATITLKT